MRVYRLPPAAGAYLFDIDGTLYTDDEYVRHQVDALIDELAKVRGLSREAALAAVDAARARLSAASGGASTSLGNAMASLGVDIATSVEWRRRLLDPARFLKPDPRLAQALGELAQGAVLVAVTNNPRSVGEATLSVLGVSGLFARVVGLDDTMRSKPAPEPYLMAARIAGVPAEACVSVGDRYDVDLAVPLALGMGAVLVDGVEDVYLLPGLAAGSRRA